MGLGWLCLALAFVAWPARAGVNANGVLLVHGDLGVEFTRDQANYCGLSSVEDCSQIVTQVPMEQWHRYMIYVMAAFPDSTPVRLRGVTFGLDYDPTALKILGGGTCADLEYIWGGWPANGTGTLLIWRTTQYSHLTDVYWFSAYCYGKNPTSLLLTTYPGGPGEFTDDGVPSITTPITGYGTLGFGQPGYRPPCNGSRSSGPEFAVADSTSLGAERSPADRLRSTPPAGAESNPPATAPPAGAKSDQSSRSDLGRAEATFQLASGNRVVIELDEGQREFGAGERIHVAVRDGRGEINGIRFRPWDPPPDSAESPAELPETYDKIPFIQDYVIAHLGDSPAAWREAGQVWRGRTAEARGLFGSTYRRLRLAGISRAVAAESTLTLARSCALIDSARVDEIPPDSAGSELPSSVSPRSAGARTDSTGEVLPVLSIRWLGRARFEEMALEARLGPPPAGQRLTAAELGALRSMLRAMQRGRTPFDLYLRRGEFSWGPKAGP